MTSQLQSVEDLTQESVRHIFLDALGMEATPRETVQSPEDEAQIIGSVGFVGDITGIIYIYLGFGFARAITTTMLGMTEEEVGDGEALNDAIGELSNMIVGYVKSRLSDRGATCILTIPSVVRGQNLSVEGLACFERSVTGFGCGAHQFNVELLLKQN